MWARADECVCERAKDKWKQNLVETTFPSIKERSACLWCALPERKEWKEGLSFTVRRSVSSPSAASFPPSPSLLESIWSPFSPSLPLSITRKYNNVSRREKDERLFAPNCTQPSQRRKRWADRERRGEERRGERREERRGEERREERRGERREAGKKSQRRREERGEMKDVFVQYHRLTHLSYLLPSQTICP